MDKLNIIDVKLHGSFNNLFVLYLAHLIVHNNLDNQYIKNEKLVLKKISKQIMCFKKCFDEQIDFRLIVNFNFLYEKSKLIKFINTINNNIFNKFKEMFIFQTVSILEKLANQFLYNELITLNLNHRLINEEILHKLGVKDKLSWFMEIVSKKNFVRDNTEIWNNFNNLIKLRNFFIHYKPEHLQGKYDLKFDFTKEKAIIFLKNCHTCYLYLIRSQTAQTKIINQRIDKIKKVIKQRKISIWEYFKPNTT